jgi:hypothetical protein
MIIIGAICTFYSTLYSYNIGLCFNYQEWRYSQGGPGVRTTPASTRTTHEIRANPRTGREGQEEKEKEREGGERRKSFGLPSSVNLAPPLSITTAVFDAEL